MRKYSVPAGLMNQINGGKDIGIIDFVIGTRVITQIPEKNLLIIRGVSFFDHHPCNMRSADGSLAGFAHNFIIADLKTEFVKFGNDLPGPFYPSVFLVAQQFLHDPGIFEGESQQMTLSVMEERTDLRTTDNKQIRPESGFPCLLHPRNGVMIGNGDHLQLPFQGVRHYLGRRPFTV